LRAPLNELLRRSFGSDCLFALKEHCLLQIFKTGVDIALALLDTFFNCLEFGIGLVSQRIGLVFDASENDRRHRQSEDDKLPNRLAAGFRHHALNFLESAFHLAHTVAQIKKVLLHVTNFRIDEVHLGYFPPDKLRWLRNE
jgi:hypothetical protein